MSCNKDNHEAAPKLRKKTSPRPRSFLRVLSYLTTPQPCLTYVDTHTIITIIRTMNIPILPVVPQKVMIFSSVVKDKITFGTSSQYNQ